MRAFKKGGEWIFQKRVGVFKKGWAFSKRVARRLPKGCGREFSKRVGQGVFKKGGAGSFQKG
jgi:hypothetical protein